MEATVKKYNPNNEQELIMMMKDFYNSPAVLHKVNDNYFNNTIKMLNEESLFCDCYILYVDGNVAGYMLLALTYSNEVGGDVVWIEEVYLKEEYKGQKLSKALVNKVLDNYPNAKRFRIEAVRNNNISINLFSLFGFERFEYIQLVKDI